MRKLLIMLALYASTCGAASVPVYDVQARDSFLHTDGGDVPICTVRIGATSADDEPSLFSVPADCHQYLAIIKSHSDDVFGPGAVVNYTINGDALNVI